MLQILYPAHSINPGTKPQGGAEFYAIPLNITDAQNVTLTYSVFFPADFDYVLAGKLPGLYGGHGGCSGGYDATDCFSTRLMWRKGGLGELYLVSRRENDSGYVNGVPPSMLLETSKRRLYARIHNPSAMLITVFPSVEGHILGQQVAGLRSAKLSASTLQGVRTGASPWMSTRSASLIVTIFSIVTFHRVLTLKARASWLEMRCLCTPEVRLVVYCGPLLMVSSRSCTGTTMTNGDTILTTPT